MEVAPHHKVHSKYSLNYRCVDTSVAEDEFQALRKSKGDFLLHQHGPEHQASACLREHLFWPHHALAPLFNFAFSVSISGRTLGARS